MILKKGKRKKKECGDKKLEKRKNRWNKKGKGNEEEVGNKAGFTAQDAPSMRTFHLRK